MSLLRTTLAITGAVIVGVIATRRTEELAGAGGARTGGGLPRRPVGLGAAFGRALNPPPSTRTQGGIASVIPAGFNETAGSMADSGVRTPTPPAHHEDPIFTSLAMEYALGADGHMQAFIGRLLRDEPAPAPEPPPPPGDPSPQPLPPPPRPWHHDGPWEPGEAWNTSNNATATQSTTVPLGDAGGFRPAPLGRRARQVIELPSGVVRGPVRVLGNTEVRGAGAPVPLRIVGDSGIGLRTDGEVDESLDNIPVVPHFHEGFWARMRRRWEEFWFRPGIDEEEESW